MVIFDQDGNVLENPDMDLGRLEERKKQVILHCCIDDDADQVITIHDQSCAEVPYYDGHIPDGMPVGAYLATDWVYYVYIPYTEAELLERKVSSQTVDAIKMFVTQADLDDEAALKVDALYPDWEVGIEYKLKDIRRYEGNIYRCIQANKSVAEHTPDASVAQWKKILPAEEPGGYLPWVQPLGATDAYNTGDRVTHNDKTWESTCDNNVWEPGVYGWIEVSE